MRDMVRSKPSPNPTPPAEKASSDGLLTSEDLFGDLVDQAPDRKSAPATPTAPGVRRRGPIRVKITEPQAAAAAPKTPGPPLPADVEALLDRLEPVGGQTPVEPFLPQAAAEAALASDPDFAPVDHDDDLLADLAGEALGIAKR